MHKSYVILYKSDTDNDDYYLRNHDNFKGKNEFTSDIFAEQYM